jgi:hypothetical protein
MFRPETASLAATLNIVTAALAISSPVAEPVMLARTSGLFPTRMPGRIIPTAKPKPRPAAPSAVYLSGSRYGDVRCGIPHPNGGVYKCGGDEFVSERGVDDGWWNDTGGRPAARVEGRCPSDS